MRAVETQQTLHRDRRLRQDPPGGSTAGPATARREGRLSVQPPGPRVGRVDRSRDVFLHSKHSFQVSKKLNGKKPGSFCHLILLMPSSL